MSMQTQTQMQQYERRHGIKHASSQSSGASEADVGQFLQISFLAD